MVRLELASSWFARVFGLAHGFLEAANNKAVDQELFLSRWLSDWQQPFKSGMTIPRNGFSAGLRCVTVSNADLFRLLALNA